MERLTKRNKDWKLNSNISDRINLGVAIGIVRTGGVE